MAQHITGVRIFLWSGLWGGKVNDTKWEGYINEPAIITVTRGIEAYQQRVYERGGAPVHCLAYHKAGLQSLVRLKHIARRGDVFLWMSILNRRYTGNDYAGLRRQGVYTVHYNTEIVDQCWYCTEGDNWSEVWEFSHHNLDVCRTQCAAAGVTSMPRTRYVPLGLQELSPSAVHPAAAPPLTFFGLIDRRLSSTTKAARGRYKLWQMLGKSVAREFSDGPTGGGQLNHVWDVWSNADFAKVREHSSQSSHLMVAQPRG